MSFKKKVTIEADANTKPAVRDLDEVGRAFDRVAKKAGEAHTQFAAVGKQADGIDRVRSSASQLTGTLGKVSGVAAGLLGGGVIGALGGALGGQLVDAIDETTARSMELQKTFGNLPFSIDAARIATEGMVTNFDLAKAASKAAGLGVAKNSEEFATLADDARRLGLDLAAMAEGIHKGNTGMLAHAGIVMDADKVVADYAKTLGVAVDKLTDEQKAEGISIGVKKKIHEAALKVVESTDGAAAAVQRFKVELQNLEDETLTGELPTRRLEDGLLDLARAGTLAGKHLRHQRLDVLAVEEALESVGVRSREYADITNFELADAVEKADEEWGRWLKSLAAEHKLTTENIPELEKYVQLHDQAAFTTKILASRLKDLQDQAARDDLEKAFAATEAMIEQFWAGPNSEMIQDRIEEQDKARAERAKKALEAQQKIFQQQLMIARNAQRMQAAGEAFADRGTALPSMEMSDAAAEFGKQRQQEQKLALLQVEIDYRKQLREIEFERISAEVQGLSTAEFDEEVRQAEIAHLETKIDLTSDLVEKQQLQDEIEAKLHERRIARLRQTTAVEKKQRETFLAMRSAIVDGYMSIGQAALRSALMGEGGIRKKVGAMAAAESLEMTISAATETARGVIAAASPLTAALAPGHFAAAAKAAATAAAVGALAGGLGGFGGFGGGGGGVGVGGGAFTGADFGGRSSGGQQQSNPGDRPIYSSNAAQPRAAGTTVIINAQINQLTGSDSEQSLTELKSKMAKQGLTFGN